MNRFAKKSIKSLLLAMVVASLALQPVFAQTLYEKYTQSSKEDLEPETRDMGKQLTRTFNAASINKKRQEIEFAKYFSNLKKLVLYGTKLAAYGEYEKDLHYARDNDIFKGLAEEPSGEQSVASDLDRRQFVDDKFKSMKKNVEEEIDTYVDLIMVSLDVCEYLTQYDLSELLSNPEYSERIQRYGRSEEFANFEAKKRRLSAGWPDLERRISAQFSIWGAKAASPDDPLISPGVTGAL